jgi:hypothetical protein
VWLLPSWAYAANETATDPVAMVRQRIGDLVGSYITSGCLPTVPASSLTLAAFACEGAVAEGRSSIPVSQPAATVGPLSATAGSYWIALYKDRTTTVGGWTHQLGTHYLWQASATQPADPAGGTVIAQVTVAGSVITGVADYRQPVSYVQSGVYDVTDPLYGARCDGTTHDTTAIQQALAGARTGAVVALPQGTCLVNAPLAITKALALHGAGIGQSILSQATAAQAVLTNSASNVRLQGFTVRHQGTPVAGGDGIVMTSASGVDAVYLEHVEALHNWRGFVLGCASYGWGSHLRAQQNDSHGFEFTYGAACGTAQWDIGHSLSQLNKGTGFAGVNTASPNGIGPWLTQTVSFGNEFGGYSFDGSAGHPINDLRLSGVISSGDNRGGIFLDTYGTGHLLTDPWVELAGQLAGLPQGSAGTASVASGTGHGLRVTSNTLTSGVTITGGRYWNNSWSGVSIDAAYVTLTGGTSLGNGLAHDADLSRRAGVHIGNSGVSVSGHTFGYLNAPATLHHIHLGGTLLDLAIGQNAYQPGLSNADFIHGADAVLATTVQPIMAAGLMVHTGTPEAFALGLVDANVGAPNGLKFLRAAAGNLEILGADATTVLSRLSNTGTPSWPARRGQLTIADANTTGVVTLSPSEPDASYFVQLTASAAAGGPASGAYTVGGVVKTSSTFTVTVTAAPGAGKSVTYDWFVHR